MSDRRVKIGKRFINGIVAPTGHREDRYWDIDIRGFFVRVRPTGRIVYALKYRVGRQQRVLTLGAHGSPWTPESAREAARKALDRVRGGEDPSHAKQEARAALTVNELIDLYLTEGVETKIGKRASTWAVDGSNLRRHIRPLIGTKIANLVSKADAAKAIKDIAEGKTAMSEKTARARGLARVTGGVGTSRRTKITTAAMFAWGVEHGYVKTNPFASIKLTASPMRERFLTPIEAKALLEAIDLHLERPFADAAKLLLFTGARKTEILGLQWSEVDLERKALRLPPERTKAGGKTGARQILLSTPAVEILRARQALMLQQEPDDRSSYVFPDTKGRGCHMTGLRRPFLKACKAIGLTDVRLHDLRHSFASLAVANGVSLLMVSKLLGHASARTTERYAHLSNDPLMSAAEQVAIDITSPIVTTN